MTAWKTVTLGEVCTLLNGSTPSKTNAEYWQNGDVNWFTINDLRNQEKEIYETEQKVTEFALADTSLKMMPANTVLLCCTASLGATALTRVPTTSNQQFVGLVPKSGVLDADFLYYYCLTLTAALHKVSGSATIAYVANSKLKTLAIPLPPLPVQKAIVAKLDAAFASIEQAIAAAGRNAENAKQLFQSYLSDVFERGGAGWVELRLKDVCELNNGRAYNKDELLKEGKYPVLRVGNFFTNKNWYRSD